MTLPSAPKPVFSSGPIPMPSHNPPTTHPTTSTPISPSTSSSTLLPSHPPPPKTLASRLTHHLTQPLPSTATPTTTTILLLLTICTGIQDATTFPDYHCFASNQTGNTIFLTLAVILPSLNGKMFVTSNIAVALCCFLLGAFVTGQMGHCLSRRLDPRRSKGRKPSRSRTVSGEIASAMKSESIDRAPKTASTSDNRIATANAMTLRTTTTSSTSGVRTRWLLLLTNGLQTLLVLLAALLQHLYPVHLTSTPDLCVIGLLACASGSQVVQSRSFQCTEISTAMATAAWVDLVVDPELFAWGVGSAATGGDGNNAKEGRPKTRGRDRRIMFIIALVIGGFLGAVLYRFGGSKVAIAVSGMGKGVVVVGFWFHEGETGDEEERGVC